MTRDPRVRAALRLLRARADLAALAAIVAVLFFLPRGLPSGVTALGTVGGITIAANALALVLVYRSTRVVNFAQTAFAAVGVVLFYLWDEHLQWVVLLKYACGSCVPWVSGRADLQNHPAPLLHALLQQWGVHHNLWAGFLLQANFWLSAAIALWLATQTGRVTGQFVTRFWGKAPRLIPTVAMLGHGAALAIGAPAVMTLRQAPVSIFDLPTVKPFWWWPYDETNGPQGRFYLPMPDLPPPYLRVGIATFHVWDVITVLVTLAIFAAVIAYFRYSRSGVVIRGLAENAERAQTLGIDSDRMVVRTWTIGGLIAGISGVMAVMASGPLGVPGGPDVSQITRILAIAVFARLASLPLVLVAAVALGIIDQGLFWNFNSHAVYNGLIVVIVGAALLLQQSRASRAEQEASVAWLASPEIRPTPRQLRDLPLVRNWKVAGSLALAVVLLGFPLAADPSQLTLGSFVLIQAILGVSLLVLTGWAGQISLGQVAFAAVGAYVAVMAAVAGGAPFPLALLAAGIVGAGSAALVGVPALRIRGPYLIVMTLAATVAVVGLLLNPTYLGGRLPSTFTRPLVLGLDLDDEHTYYYVCLVLLGLCVAGVMGLRRSRTRRALIAARDNEPAAQVFGIDLLVARLEGFAVSGFLAGLAGALLAFESRGVKIQTFNPDLSILVFLMLVLGGAGSLAGPLVGAGFLGVLSLIGDAWTTFGTGGGVVAILRYAPGGLGGLAFKGRDSILRRVAVRNRIAVPSLMADFSHTSQGAIRARIRAKQRTGGGTDFIPVKYRLAGDGPGPVEGTWLSTHGNGHPAALSTAPDPASALSSAESVSALLACQKLDVRYDSVQALFGVDFEVRAGEILGLVGTNGAGKTTLLRAIAGLHHPSAGVIRVDGEDVTRTGAAEIARRGIALVPGGAAVFPSLTVEENLRLAGWSSRDGAEARLEQVLVWFPRLRERLAAAAGDLSGGEQQMLALAQAFIIRPRLLMVDELSLGLSPQVVEVILNVLRELRSQGTAIIVVEQSLNLTLTIAQRAVVLEKGEVRYAGTARRLLDHPELFQSISFGAGGVVGGSEIARRRRAFEAAQEIALSVDSVRASYGGVVAVDGVGFEVAAGEVVGVIGPNGAGKTTLFDVVSGFQPAERGQVVLLGVDVTGMRPAARARLGLQRSFQNVRLFPSLTVRDNIATALERHLGARNALVTGLWLPPARSAERRAQARVDMLIELMGLKEHEEKVMTEISTGTRRIVDIACQLAARPKVLLLDEPSSGLAQIETEALGPLISRIAKDLDCAVVVVEHDIPLVSSVSDRLLAMDLGRVIALGPPDEVLADSAVVSAYFGGAPEEVIRRSGQRHNAAREVITT